MPTPSTSSRARQSRFLGHHVVGRVGELLAALWLLVRGYRILARNTRHGGVELDILARRRDVLHVVEVKCRARRDAWAPGIAVGPAKRARLERGARATLAEAGRQRRGQPAAVHPFASVSFDVVEVWLWPPRLRHHVGAFRCDER
ncbi:MAG: YraN family protein [Myxococcales bacterium]|nr:YraN family protein [Myxococcales bacterium]